MPKSKEKKTINWLALLVDLLEELRRWLAPKRIEKYHGDCHFDKVNDSFLPFVFSNSHL